MKFFSSIILIFVSLCSFRAIAAGINPYAFTLDGQLYSTGTTTPLLDSSASVTVQIYDPAGTCLLYQETQVVNTVPSNGYFNIQVGSATGAGKRTAGVDPGNTMAKIYQNTSAIPCQSGSYTPVDGDQRVVRLTVTPSASGVPDTLTPDIALNSMPMAKVAETVQGLAPASLLQVNNSGSVALTQTNLESVFTGTGWSNIQSVLAGTYSSSSSSVVASTGSVGAPSISFSGDSDTGFYSVGANRIGITAGGSNIFIVDASGIVAGTTGGASISTANGTAAAPTFSFAGDTGTGWFRPAASTLAASTGGAEKIRITSTGYVGIGTTTPGSTLDVKGTLRLSGSTSGYVGLATTAAAGSTTYTLPAADGTAGQVLSTDGTGILSWITAGGGGGFPIALGSASTPSMNFSGDTNTGLFSPGADTVAVSTSGTEKVRITSTGYVGIGTTSPDFPLTVDTLSNTSLKLVNTADNPAHYITLGRYTYLNAFNDGFETLNINYDGAVNKRLNFVYGTRVSDPLDATYPARLAFSTRGGLDVMTLDQSGNVGIGTTAPNAPLDIATGKMRVSTSSTHFTEYGNNQIYWFQLGMNAGKLTFVGPTMTVYDSTSGSDVMTFQANSNGIRTDSITSGGLQGTTYSPLILSSNYWSLSSTTPAIEFKTFDSSGSGLSASHLQIFNGDTGKVLINPNGGYVGIGTTTPGSSLDVKGTLRLSGSTSGYVGLATTAAAGSTTYTLPAADGTAGQVLSTNGTGILSWTTASGGGFPVALGSASTPSMNFSGDTNTGIFSPGADTVAVSTSGTERLRVNSSGYIGIGTTNPTLPITISAYGPSIKLSDDSDNPNHYLNISSGNQGQNDYLLDAFYDGNEVLKLYFDQATQEGVKFVYGTRNSSPTDATYPAKMNFVRRGGLNVMTMDSSGYVGIGTTSPGSSLDVQGTLRLSGSTSGYVGLATTAAAGSTTYTLPAADGTAGQVLSTNGTGILSWTTASGGFPVALGSASTPSMNFSGDTNTGIFSPGADTVAVSTSGTERIRVTSTGYVGIGTTTPQFALHIKEATTGSGAFNPTLLLEGASVGSDGGPYMQFRNSVVNDLARIVGNDSGNFGGNLLFATKDANGSGLASDPSTEKMRITSSGYVGIGTTSPGSSLDVKGTLRLSGSTSGYVGLATTAAAGSTTYTLPAADGTAGQVLSTNGTGILSWTTASGGGTTGIAVGSAGTPSISFSGDTDTGWWHPAADTLAASTSGTERFRINSSGYVGIGITNPSYLLDVQGSSVRLGNASMNNDTSHLLQVGNSGGDTYFNVGQDAGTNLEFGWKYSATPSNAWGQLVTFGYNNDFRIDVRHLILQNSSGGNVGIGVGSPGARLDVKDTIRISGSGSGYVGLKAATAAGSTTYTLPAADGTAGQVLSTDGTGILSWTTASGGGGTTGIALGSEGTPSISFTADTNTGIWSPGADTVAVSTSGSERLRVTSTGYVGIGTTSPLGQLQVGGAINAAPQANAFNTSSAYTSLVLGAISGATADNGGLFAFARKNKSNSPFTGLSGWDTGSVRVLAFGGGSWDVPDATQISFYTADTYNETNNSGAERMRITNSGIVGIGTTSPSSTALLDVSSTSKGFLPPRMTTTQRDAITSPATGLTIYNTTTNSLNIYNGSAWIGSLDFSSGTSVSTGSNYQATGAGFVVAFGSRSSGICSLTGYSDSSSTPTTVVAQDSTPNAASTYTSIMFPVKAGQYYKVVNANCTMTAKFYEMSGIGVGGMAAASPWALNGTSAYYQSGNVGIGTNNPTEPLVVVDSSGNTLLTSYRVNSGSALALGDAGTGLRFTSESGRTAVYNLSQIKSELSNDDFSTPVLQVSADFDNGQKYISGKLNSTTETFYVDVTGNSYFAGKVGIGTTPASAYLTVNNGTTVGTYTTTGWIHSSDARLKKDIKTIENALDKVTKLRGVEYKFLKDKENKTQLGFIAQETEKVFPEVVITNSEGFKSMNYANLVSPVVEAIKEMSVKFADLFKKTEDHSRVIALLEKENENLKALVEKTQQENAAVKSRLDKIEKRLKSK